MGGGVENTNGKTIGFTLAELLAVIVILGVIALIAFPAVNKVIKNSKEKAYTAQKEIILSSAKNWGIDHINDLSEVDDVYLSIEDLRLGGYLEKKQVINPITDEEMNGCVVISYSNDYSQYQYHYEEASCSEVNDVPIITLNGDRVVTINQDDEYIELGAKAFYKSQDISSNIVITGSVDTSVAGSYTIRYNVSHDGKKAKEAIRTVKVIGSGVVEPGGSEMPVIVLQVLNNSFNENGWAREDISIGVTIDDVNEVGIKEYQYCYGEDCIPSTSSFGVTDPIIVSSESDSNYVCAIAVDNNDNESEKVCVGPYKLDKSVVVPTVTSTKEPNSNGWYKEDIILNITVENELSGIQEMKYCSTIEEGCIPDQIIDDGGQILINTESGSNRVCFYVVDKAGNASTTECSEYYKLDKTVPSLTVPINVEILPSRVSEYDLTLGASATDELSGIDGAIITSGSLSAVEKTYTITYQVLDKAGNSTSKTRMITVKGCDKTTQTIMGKSITTCMATNDSAKNIRFVGDPTNYVKFNNELWRIIGIFSGQAKIIRNEPYSAGTNWDENESNGGHGENGFNDWSKATLQTKLNTTFLNSIDSTSLTYVNTTYNWRLGAADNGILIGHARTRGNMYGYERGSNVYSGRPTSWTGAIGLMYPSDYGYATSSTNNICNTSDMSTWSVEKNAVAYHECALKSWLYNSSYHQWTITPFINDSAVFRVGKRGYVEAWNSVSSGGASWDRSVDFPVVYLKSTVKIKGGLGTASNPFTLGM